MSAIDEIARYLPPRADPRNRARSTRRCPFCREIYVHWSDGPTDQHVTCAHGSAGRRARKQEDVPEEFRVRAPPERPRGIPRELLAADRARMGGEPDYTTPAMRKGDEERSDWLRHKFWGMWSTNLPPSANAAKWDADLARAEASGGDYWARLDHPSVPPFEDEMDCALQEWTCGDDDCPKHGNKEGR